MSTRSGVERFSISAPPDLIREFDSTVENLGQDRSKAIQQAMRLFLSEHNWAQGEGNCAGAIVLIYNHEVHDAEEELTDLQHHYRNAINSCLHIHIDDRTCLEIIAVNGIIATVKELIDKLTASKGVKQLKHTIIGI
jgi:CopG family nickel-responsive transcriptional regulator